MRIGMADHLVSEALYLSDPDGLGIEVYADRPRASWSHQERELAMATDPLDIHGVIAAGGGQPWSQAPAGTTLGHVHLHVGNLAAAEGFYHRGIGLEKMVWSYPGALFLAAGGYHHHLGLNTWSAGPSPGENEAKLLAWELIVPTSADASRVGRQLEAQQVAIEEDANGVHAVDPWGTRVVVRAAF
jgi:catechol 2,3-dioxygenase